MIKEDRQNPSAGKKKKTASKSEVKNIVKFFYGLHTEQLEVLKEEMKMSNKKTNVLTAISTLAIIVTILTVANYLKKSIAFLLTPISSTSSSE